MGMTGRIGIIVFALSCISWVVYLCSVFIPGYKKDILNFSLPTQALIVTAVCGTFALLGWLLSKG